MLVDTNGIPLALALSPANVHDSRLFAPVLDAVPPVRQCAGRRRKRPAKLHADKGYDYDHCRRAARRRGITPRIARRSVDSSERLGRHRWIVERTLAWFARFRRLAVRYERRVDTLEAFHLLAAALICLRFVERWSCRPSPPGRLPWPRSLALGGARDEAGLQAPCPIILAGQERRDRNRAAARPRRLRSGADPPKPAPTSATLRRGRRPS